MGEESITRILALPRLAPRLFEDFTNHAADRISYVDQESSLKLTIDEPGTLMTGRFALAAMDDIWLAAISSTNAQSTIQYSCSLGQAAAGGQKLQAR